MSERVTRSGRRVKSVTRYEPEEVNLVDDFSDGSFDDSDFDGTSDGVSEGSHMENSSASDESYKDQTEWEGEDSGDDSGLETDEDSVITEHVPEEDIIDIPTESDEGSSDTCCETDSSTED